MNTGCQIIVLDRNVDIKKSDRGFRDFPFQFKDAFGPSNKVVVVVAVSVSVSDPCLLYERNAKLHK